MVDYIEKIQYQDQPAENITSPCFNSNWVIAGKVLASNLTYTSGTYYNFSLSDYLPNDGYDYEVYITTYVLTSGSSGNNVYGYMYSGTNHNYFSAMVGSSRAQVNAGRSTCRVCILPVKATDKVVAYMQNGGANAVGVYINAVAYRRIGKNTGTNRISQIQFPNSNSLQFGGKCVQGKWVKKEATLLTNYTIPATSGASTDSSRTVVSLADYLPNDGYDYEVYLSGQCNTNATDGAVGNLRVWLNLQQEIGVGVDRNDAGNNKTFLWTFINPVRANNKNLYFCNPWASSEVYTWASAHGYRRMGVS